MALGDAAAFMRPRLDAAATRRDTLAAYIESNLAFMRDHPAHIRALVETIGGTRGDGGVPLLDVPFPGRDGRVSAVVAGITSRGSVPAGGGCPRSAVPWTASRTSCRRRAACTGP